MLVMKLVTKEGQRASGAVDTYYVVQHLGTYTLRTHGLAPMHFRTLDKLAHTLGGMIPWERWSSEAQLQLDHLKLRGAF
jgi:hypothetical protein